MGGIGVKSSASLKLNHNSEYIRFGKVPANERSVDWMALPYYKQPDITKYMDDHGVSASEAVMHFYKNPDKYLEKGVSVFKADSDGLPLIENYQQLRTLFGNTLGIFNENPETYKMYSLDADIVGTGRDAEPIVSSTKNIKEHTITKDMVSKVYAKALKNNYQTSIDVNKLQDSEIMDISWHGTDKTPWSPDDGKTVYYKGKKYTNPTWPQAEYSKNGVLGFKPKKVKKKEGKK